MLLKGTLKSNILTTEIGQFFVSRKGDQEITGVFDVENIKPSQIEKPVSVDGYQSVIQIPIMEAKITAVYLKKFDSNDRAEKSASSSAKESKLDNQTVINDKQPANKAHDNGDAPKSITVTEKPSLQSLNEESTDQLTTLQSNDSSNYDTAEESLSNEQLRDDPADDVTPQELTLFGKPYQHLSSPYKIDASLNREKQREIIDFLKSKGAQFQIGTQEWHLNNKGDNA
ncbi:MULTISPECIES: hypothetical protein [Cysteiniphilum]|uniref:Uncharacterized protein n=1 Tax=Cysteiniphilum litorale TaxID=2056700 RepID=A0A8J3E7U1_9GAMM|nr:MULTISPECIES: hypothetical protein [Cysteiniphilum]GGF93054.1 hypothetical protein GCM10010995_07750 [Cysteiniphilum litorale]